MGIRFKCGAMTPLPPDENVLYIQSKFRAVTGTSLPSYKIYFNLPPAWALSLYITNRRCLIVTRLFGVFTQEMDLWYPACKPAADSEYIISIACVKGLFGKCLEIRSFDPLRPKTWLCSKKMTLRFFLNNAEHLESIIRSVFK